MNKLGVTVSRILCLLFILGIIIAAVAFNASKPRVMILHSYHPNYPWTRDVDLGISRVSAKWSRYAITRYYMDTKKHFGKEWLRYAGISARRAIDRFAPDVLIAVDDMAQKLAAKHYVDNPRINIVFAAVNGLIKAYGYEGAERVTGIYEHKPLQALKEMILTMNASKENPKETPSVLYLMDPSPSMIRDKKFIEAFDWDPIKFSESIIAEDYDQWKQQVTELEQRGIDYLLVANYRTLPRSEREPDVPSPKEIMQWTEAHSPVPVIGVNIFNVEDGGAIAIGASPFEQGEVAAAMAEEIIEKGLRGGVIPMVVNHQYIVAINQTVLGKRNLNLPTIYEIFARTTATYLEDVE